MILHNRHHKVSQSVPFFMRHKAVTILLTIRIRGHFVMSVTKNHESHDVPVLDNRRSSYKTCLGSDVTVSQSFLSLQHTRSFIVKNVPGYPSLKALMLNLPILLCYLELNAAPHPNDIVE